MKLDDLIQRVQSLYSKGLQSDDSRLSSRHIYNKFLTVRPKLLTQQANKKQQISSWNYQTIPCIELIEVPSHECPCVPPFGCSVLRSRFKIPNVLTSIFGTLISSVTTINRGIKIDEMSFNGASYQKGNKYTSKKINFFIHQQYLYITTPAELKAVSMTAVFEDPIKVTLFAGLCECCDCVDCTDYKEMEFPIDNDLIEPMIELTNLELIEAFRYAQEDTRNDSSDDQEPRQQPRRRE